MKKDIVELVVGLFALVVAGASEELAPKLSGAGVPALLSAVAVMSVRRSPLSGALFAVAAGAFEDALCSLPFATSISYFLAIAALMRGFKLPVMCAAPAFVGYQVWLWIWLGGSLNGNIFSRLFMALPLGAATLLAAEAVISWADGKGALDEK